MSVLPQNSSFYTMRKSVHSIIGADVKNIYILFIIRGEILAHIMLFATITIAINRLQRFRIDVKKNSRTRNTNSFSY